MWKTLVCWKVKNQIPRVVFISVETTHRDFSFFFPSDGEEDKENDEVITEGHEPSGQEGRVGPTRVRPQTQTSVVGEEEVGHQRSQIKIKKNHLRVWTVHIRTTAKLLANVC